MGVVIRWGWEEENYKERGGLGGIREMCRKHKLNGQNEICIGADSPRDEDYNDTHGCSN